MLHIVSGCMFAGKTTELANIFNQFNQTHRVQVLDYDTFQHNGNFIYTHDNVRVPCIKLRVLPFSIDDYDILLINEAQFFYGLKQFVLNELQNKKTIYLFGLDGDFKQEKFGEILDLLPMADTYVKLYAKCNCGSKASFSKRLSADLTQYSPHDIYIPVCRSCLS